MRLLSGKYRVFSFILLLAAAGAGAAFYSSIEVRSSDVSIRALNSKAPRDKIASAVLSQASDGNPVPVVLLLQEQADTKGARQIADWNERGRYVYKTLREHADRSQSGLRSFLETRGIPYRSFWAANMITADLSEDTLMQVAEREDVARIDPDLPSRSIEDPIVDKSLPISDLVSAPQEIEWGVANVKAPEVWALGFKGQGIVVGDLDTGVRWTHESIKSKYRGWNGSTADHNYNWWDAVHTTGSTCGADSDIPCDDNGHGTHTVGTILGHDGGANQVGVAPDAKWIGCRNMDRGNGTPTTYTECFQFMIAPTDSAGNNADPSKRPHVLSNSWTCTSGEGCTSGEELKQIVKSVVLDSGIFMVMSAGNAGSGCSSLGFPGMYQESFSVGSIGEFVSAEFFPNMLSSFSSRGPSSFYDPVLIKPNLSAPGRNVRSATFNADNTYGAKTGTSMAAPHVAGVVALLWSARPSLIGNIEETKAILQNTANPDVTLTSPQSCGGIASTQIPNNSFGYGRVDALATLNVGFSGRVITPAGNGLSNAVVKLSSPNGTSRTVRSNPLGFFTFSEAHLGGNYSLTITSKRFRFLPQNVAVSENMPSMSFVGQE